MQSFKSIRKKESKTWKYMIHEKDTWARYMSKIHEQGNLRGKHTTNIHLKICSNLLENRKYKSRSEWDTNIHSSDRQKLRYLTISNVGKNVDQQDFT